MKREYDFLLVGAGLFNAVFSWQAKQYGKRCLVIDKRCHVGGNIYCEDIEGINVHRYGPHIFHTNNEKIWRFVNQFAPFNHFILCPIANYHGKIYNLPFNMNTFYQMWGVVTPTEAKAKIREQAKSIVTKPSNLEEQAVSLVGWDIYNTLIKGYTEKQWGCQCTKLPCNIIKRLPVRFTYDNNYFNDRYQGIPEGGYNRLIDGLLKGIECKINCNYFEDKSYFDGLADKIIFTGAIDEYFGFRLGHLEYRSLRFETKLVHTENFQGNAMVNYTDSQVPYTRIVEHKHFDVNNLVVHLKPYTVITYEYPISLTHNQDEQYYPVVNPHLISLYNEYLQLIDKKSRVVFGGRLGLYKYYNMDQIIEEAIKMACQILNI